MFYIFESTLNYFNEKSFSIKTHFLNIINVLKQNAINILKNPYHQNFEFQEPQQHPPRSY